jgi:hypothetical protein
MAVLAAVFGVLSRFVGKVLTTTLGWASTLLFGRVPASRQIFLVALTFGSVLWAVTLVGILVPDVGTFLLALVPGQDVIPEDVVRLGMLAAALAIPAGVGALTLILADRPHSPKVVLVAIARGYPLTVLLAGILVFLAGLAVTRKARSLVKGWTDAHVPFVVDPGAYDDVAGDLDAAVTAAGLEVAARPAPAVMSQPARWLAAVAGAGRGGLVPDQLIQLTGPDIDILIYPMDVLITGKPGFVTRARAAVASRLTTSHAHLTVTAEAQEIEDRLTALARADDARRSFDDVARTEFASIDETLMTVEIPYEEWEVVYRQRLQVERDLRAASMAAGPALPDASRIMGSVADAIGDPKTLDVLDRASGRSWRVGVALASVVVAIVAGWLQRDRALGRGLAPLDPPVVERTPRHE